MCATSNTPRAMASPAEAEIRSLVSMAAPQPARTGPLFTLVCPLYNVGEYLPEFFSSLEAQTFGLENLEVILVDDGSTDGITTVRAQNFCAKHPSSVTFIRQENGGQASARNLGLSHSNGEWITFPDPDDKLNADYFSEVATHLAEATSRGNHLDVLSARIVMWHPDTSRPLRDDHALAKRYLHGPVVKNLSENPDWVQPHVTSGFLRRSVVTRNRIQFPESLRYRFEDGCFISEYLLAAKEPHILFIPDAHYFYRQRADNSSTLQSSKSKQETYIDTIEVGFTHLVRSAMRQQGCVPIWLQTLFLYDQFWVLRASQGGELRKARFPAEMYEKLSILIPWVLQHIDTKTIQEFSLMPVLPWMKEVLIAIQNGNSSIAMYHGKSDPERGLRSFVYRFAGDAPTEEFFADGVAVRPHFEKNQSLEYAAGPLGWQRTLWFPLDADVEFFIGGNRVSLTPNPPKFRSAYSAPPHDNGEVDRQPSAGGKILKKVKKLVQTVLRRTRPGGLMYLRLDCVLRLGFFKRRYRNAWVFIDRDTDANDSAEDLYRWITLHHPEVNSWFLIRKNTEDWYRLKQAGFNLLAYGSLRHWAALSNALHFASSQADRFITHSVPPQIRRRYKFTFLQHGVIKGDISGWLNPKTIDLFVTSTEPEYQYVAGDSPFRFGKKEVRLTGLPRHDALLQLASQAPSQGLPKILVMPTWRDYLVGTMTSTSGSRTTSSEFNSTRFAREWGGFLQSESLLDLARQHNCEIVFMPHPNMHGYLDAFRLPDEIRVASYQDTNLRPLLVEAKLLITDYSSMAFNAAYLEKPTIYFQFDRDEYFVGHTERPGYFDYERDGYGPVCRTSEQVISDLQSILCNGTANRYLDRMAESFPVRDGGNCERVFSAMQELHLRRGLEERASPMPSDRWSTQSSSVTG